MKTYLVLTLLFMFAACNSNAPAPTKASSSSPAGVANKTGGTTTPTPTVSVPTVTAVVVRVKNYNQYNMTLEKLTGLNRSNYNSIFDTLKASLPADNEIGGLTPFNLVAMTRLADAYCTDFVNREATTGLVNDIFPLDVNDTRDFLLHRFLDMSEKEERFLSLKNEVENILKNDDGVGGEIFVNVPRDINGSKGLVVAACVAILASPYITLLE